MKIKLINIQNILIKWCLILALIIFIFLPLPKLNIHSQNTFKTFWNLFLTNLLASIQLLIPFYNIFVVFIQICFNSLIVKAVLFNNIYLILKLIPHLMFEVLSAIIAFKTSYEFINIFVKEKLNYMKILKNLTLITILLFTGAILEYFISGRINV